MYRDDNERLGLMLDAALQVRNFTAEKCRADLDSEPILLHALVRLLEIIGEAANGISIEFKDDHPEISWKDIIRMRNRLIHGYFDVNLDVVWQTVVDDIPILINLLTKLGEHEK